MWRSRKAQTLRKRGEDVEKERKRRRENEHLDDHNF